MGMLSLDDLLDEDFESFEKFSGNRRNMRESAPRDRSREEIRSKRREHENMREELEREQESQDFLQTR